MTGVSLSIFVVAFVIGFLFGAVLIGLAAAVMGRGIVAENREMAATNDRLRGDIANERHARDVLESGGLAGIGFGGRTPCGARRTMHDVPDQPQGPH